VDPKTAYERRSEFRFIDVRKAYEWEAGHIAGAIHVTLQAIPARIVELERDRPVVVTCQIGQRSGLTAQFLREQGYDAHNLEGGVTRWVDEGYPLISGDGGAGEIVDGWAETLEW
jgi:rhodanese-related sulfurtransferase